LKEKLNSEKFPFYNEQKFHLMIISWYPCFTDEMKNDWEIVVEAVSKRPALWDYIPEKFKENLNFVLEVFKNSPWSSTILKRNAWLRGNRKFCLATLLNSDYITNGVVPKELMDDREFICEGVSKYGIRVFNNLPDHNKSDIEIVWMSKKYHTYIRNVSCCNLKFNFQ
jgi:hypothetical protein